MSNENVPAVRFGGFTQGWVSQPFGQLVNRSSHISYDTYLPRVEYEDITPGLGTLNKDIYTKESHKPGLLFEPYDVLFGKLRPYLKNWLHPEFRGIAVGDFWVLRANHIEPNFLFQLIQTNSFESITNISSGSKMPRADWALTAAEKFQIPESYDEQQNIGELFNNLDVLIATHRAKHRALKQAKTSLLQRLFPRDGADEPEIRVADFSGKWKTRSMKKQAAYSKGKGYSKSDYSFEGTPLFLYGRIYTKYEIFVTTVDTFAHMQPGSVLSKGGEVLVPSSGETAEDIAVATVLMQPGVLLGGDLNVIRPSPDLDSVFLALTLSHGEPKAILEKRAQGKSVVHLNNSDIQSLNIRVPQTLQEQQTIGAIFVKLDTLITAQDAYIAKLTQIKTALLQKMFI